MHALKPSSRELLSVRKGIEWAAEDLPSGRVAEDCIKSKAGDVYLALNEKIPNTGYMIEREGKDFGIAASTQLGLMSGILNLAKAIEEERNPAETIFPRFISRFYKHEVALAPHEGGHRYVGDLDEEFWKGYTKALVRNHFTGMTFYAGYHGFEYFLDYNEFPEAPEPDKAQRAKTLAGLKRAYGTARAFGLTTMLQHYVTHFPKGLVAAYKLPLELCEVDDGRLAAFKHPVVDEYSRYIYRRTFEILPELSGFYLNFESSSNSKEFVQRCLFPEMKAAKHPVELLYRLWDFNALPEMVELVKSTPGRVRLGHKVMDRSDAYYYPKADPRVLEWKKALPKTEFTFLIGPCHNCATVQSSKMWADADFMHKLLADVQKKGADSFSFHTVFELMAPEINWKEMVGERERDMALLNRGHLEAVVDYVRGVKTTPALESKRLSERIGVDTKKATLVRKAVLDGSQISLLWLQQHHNTSAYDSYLRPGWFSTYQEPFYFLPMTCVNDDPWLPPSVETAWLNRSMKFKNIPEDVQSVVDYVNPKKKKVKRHPAYMAATLEACAKNGLAAAQKAAGKSPAGTMATLVAEATRNYHWGMRIAGEIHVAINLFSIIFAKSKAQAVKDAEKGLAEMKKLLDHEQKDDKLSARHIPLLEEPRTEQDIASLEKFIAHMKAADFPYQAFAEYMQSHLAYGEIRRKVRGLRYVDKKTEQSISKQLKEAVQHAAAAVKILEKAGKQSLADNVRNWLDYVTVELKEVKTPTMDVPLAEAVGRNEGFIRMRHDQCFRYGEYFIDDMDGFFVTRDFLRIEPVWFKVAYDKEGLVVSLKEEKIDINQRFARWKMYRGSGSDQATEILFVDREGKSRHLEGFFITSEGKMLYKREITWHARQHMSVKESVRLPDGKAEFTHTDTSWRLDYALPWKLLGGAPKKGEKWRFNISVCPAVDRNRVSSWSQGYDMRLGKGERYGTITFR